MIWTDGPVTVHFGDVRQVLQALPDESVQCVVTSPPYFGLRDYGTGSWAGGDQDCDHAERRVTSRDGLAALGERYSGGGHKAAEAPAISYRDICGRCGAQRQDQQIGLEATPEEYVCHMVEVFAEVRRVLRRDGTCWLNLGDSFAGGGGYSPGSPSNVRRQESLQSGDDQDGAFRVRGEHNYLARQRHTRHTGLKPKDLILMPARVALALQADGWWIRSDIIWAKKNSMPESVTDRPTQAHEHVFLLTKSQRYYYDAEAVREPVASSTVVDRRIGTDRARDYDQAAKSFGMGTSASRRLATGVVGSIAGRNLRSVWTIATQPYGEAHFATMPGELARRCIAAGTSERGCCPTCGAPWRRLVETTGETSRQVLARLGPSLYARAQPGSCQGLDHRGSHSNSQGLDHAGASGEHDRETRTIGWERTCSHEQEPVSCLVMDPFAGSGTTLAVARRMGRKAVGIELQQDFLPFIEGRVGKAALPLLELIG